MNYSKIQKAISSIIIPFLLFGLVFRFPINFFDSSNAGNTKLYSLVSILVNDSIYDEVESSIETYAEDIQKQFKNTRVVIIPTPNDANAFNIASLNENLYYEGYKGVKKSAKFESKLVGTILVGDFPIPIVYKGEKSSRSILPYTDFEDKSYIYNNVKEKYEPNFNNINGIEPDIWHGVISPNLGDREKNIIAINDFFKKDHDFYEGTGNFKKDHSIINGKIDEENPDDYKPYVFYYDQFREQKSLIYDKYLGYKSYLGNKEDILYNRYNKKLANKVKLDTFDKSQKKINEIITDINPNLDLTDVSEGVDIKKSPDIMTRYIIKKSIKKLIEIFNTSKIGEFKKDVYNAGRYSSDSKNINVDIVPYLISSLDDLSDSVLKEANEDMEKEIRDFAWEHAIGGLSTIAAPNALGVTFEMRDGLPIDENEYEGISTFEDNDDFINFIENGEELTEISFEGDNVTAGGFTFKKPIFGRILKVNKVTLLDDEKMEITTNSSTTPKIVNIQVYKKILEEYNTIYTNFFYGKQGEDVEEPFDCTIYRGYSDFEGKLVEANRGYNVKNGEPDAIKIEECEQIDGDTQEFGDSKNLGHSENLTEGYWTGNSPINLNPNIGDSGLELKEHTYKTAVEPIFDILGSKKEENSRYNPHQADCLSKKFLLTKMPSYNPGDPIYQVPINGQEAINWSCYTKNKKLKNSIYPQPLMMGELETWVPGTPVKDELDCLIHGVEVIDFDSGLRISASPIAGTGEECPVVKYTHVFKFRKSFMKHHSPTNEELNEQIKNPFVDSLPSDKDRSLEFASRLGPTFNIKYPYFYRLKMDIDKKFSIKYSKAQLYKFLDNWDEYWLTGDVHNLVQNFLEENPKYDADFFSKGEENIGETLHYYDLLYYPIERELDENESKERFLEENKLKGEKDLLNQDIESTLNSFLSSRNAYEGSLAKGPEAYDFNLAEYVRDKSDYVIKIGGEDKKISYYDTLAFSIYWNNLNTVTQKYKFVFENYLVDQTTNGENFYIPKNKKIYEIAYLGAPGDAQNMYIKIDPEEKEENPYSDVATKNDLLNTVLLASRLNNFSFSTGGGGSNGGADSKIDNGTLTTSQEKETATEGTFKCAPPEGVTILEWPKAVMCRLSEMLPPEIEISTSKCSSETLFDDKIENEEIFIENNIDVPPAAEKGSGGSQDGGTANITFEENLKRTCRNDLNKNGVEDCLENDLKDAKIELISSSKKSYINKYIGLEARITNSEGKIIKNLNNIFTNFELIKVEGKKDESKDFSDTNKKVIYNSSNVTKESEKNKDNYISFSNLNIPVQKGVAKFSLNSKNKESNYYIRATTKLLDKNKKEISSINSNIIKIEVRKELFFSYSYKINNEGLSNQYGENILASDKKNIFLIDTNKTSIENKADKINKSSKSKEKIVLALSHFTKGSKKISLNYPLKLSLTKNGKKVIDDINVTENNLSNFYGAYSLSKSGEYKLKITDFYGETIYRNFTINPEKASDIDIKLSTNILERNGRETSNLVILKDKYGNVANGEIYGLNIKSKGGFGFPLNDNKLSDKKDLMIYDGYKAFKIRATDENKIGEIIFNVKKDDKIILSKKENIQTIEKINIELTKPKNILVGGNKYILNAEFKDNNGKLLKDLNTRIYFSINKMYGKINGDYTKVVNGKSQIEFTTKNLASKDIPIELQIEGFREIKKDTLTINPEKAIKLDMILSKSKMKASYNSESILTVELKDIYNNIVFNDNSTKLIFETEEESFETEESRSEVIKLKDSKIKTVKNGQNNFRITGTSNPGIEYFKVKTVPDLSNNTFRYKDEVINGVGENYSTIQTYFFWDKDTFKEKTYNALYTVMLGSEYGNIKQEDYLAGSILFNKENRNLAVTSLLNNPKNYNDIISFSNNSKINNISNQNDLTTDINFDVGINDKNKLFINIQNEALSSKVGQINYNFSKNTKIGICEDTISECKIEEEKNSINLKSLDKDYNISKKGDYINITNNNNNIFSLKNDGTIESNSILKFEINSKNSKPYLIIDVKSGIKKIAQIILNTKESKTIITRDEEKSKSLLNVNSNLRIIHLSSYEYGTHDIYTSDGIITNIYYNDPFSDTRELDSFSRSNSFGLENFEKKSSIGWKGDNKFLLNFAAGKNVGEAVKSEQSFGTINLGDPLVYLKKIKNKFKNGTEKSFDLTIGKKISEDKDIFSYKVFDYDNDNLDDILLIKKDGNLKLLENKSNLNNFLDKGNLANIVDYGDNNLINTGDFSGDGFDDIFFVNNKGIPYLLNNKEKDFKRISLEKQFKLNGKIIQAEAFDMDNDTIMDIVTLDDSGEINIFYGGGNYGLPTFTKKFIGEGFGIKLSSKKTNVGALFHFDGLYQLPDEIPSDNIDKSSVNENLLNKQIFVKIPYGNGSSNLNNKNIIKKTFPEDKYGNKKATLDFIEGHSEYIKYSGTNYTKLTTFIKSEYSSSVGIKVSKKFIDKNGGNLQSGDIIDVDIIITNTSNSTKNNITYADKIQKPFIKTKEEIIIEKGRQVPPINGYDFVVNDFNLAPQESTKIKYTLKTPSINYGNIKVGLFEKGEAGDDEYGDIIVKPDNQNCSDDISFFRSLAVRTYSNLEEKSPVCDESKLKLPEQLEKNKLDSDENGVPDYIDEVVNDKGKQEEYAEEQLEILGNESLVEDSEETLLDNLDKINEKTEEILEDLDTLMQGFGCGFGGGGCISTPLNRAPLAPGNDPVLFGMPLIPPADGLRVDEGYPVFSSLTWTIVKGKCVPTFYPSSVLGPGCFGLGAGGSLGTLSPTNYIRTFVTPTLTGGVGTAVCYGAPAAVVGYANPPGVSPIVPGGNCVVAAAPLLSCSNDGSEGDPESLGIADNFGGDGEGGEGGGGGGGGGGDNSFGVINGNCSKKEETSGKTLNKEFADKYIHSKSSGGGGGGTSSIENNFSFSTNSESLFSMNGKQIGVEKIDINGDVIDSNEETFKDVEQIEQTRISSFPSFLMDWITRQIEEIVTKLADFPTLYIILPDFSGLIDTDWVEHFKKTSNIYKKGVEGETKEDFNITNKINSLKTKKASIDCVKDKIKCLSIDINISQLEGKKGFNSVKGQESGIRAAYEFLGNIPIIEIDPQRVDIDIPWVDQNSINKTLTNWKATVQQRENELNLSNKVSGGINSNANELISNLKENINTLEEYKEFPRKLTKLLNQKEIRIEQVMCNLESISELTSGRIGRNGTRFKAWVETFILIKSILKSWQLLIDIFLDYEAECHECKNERDDLLNFEFKLISMILPKFPVIIFPKWPDIILDLHNIRAGINIKIPDINITKRPIVLPNLPTLTLPEVALNVDIKFPKMKLLPKFEIPELPDIPSFPSVELPDLPPPPQLPEIFTELEGVLKILKLITKAMCLLKNLPLVPEWRAGDQIAFLTERGGYLPTDFFNISLPQFTFPYVDAIKVTTFVNLEKDNSFLVEMLKKAVEPINTRTNNILNQFQNNGLENLDFSNKSIDINKKVDFTGNKDDETSFNKNILEGINKLFSYIKDNKDKTIDNKNFLLSINDSINNQEFIKNSKTGEIKKLWKNVSNYTYSNEDKLILDLQKNNYDKFKAVDDILKNEINKNKIIQEKLKNISDDKNNLFMKVDSKVQDKDFVNYKKTLEKYNEKFLVSAKNLVEGEVDPEYDYIKKESNKLIYRVNGGLKEYSKGFKESNKLENNLLTVNSRNNTTNSTKTSCQKSYNSEYSYNYEGLYIIEKNKSYRLFNYLDELQGNETYSVIDYDKDGDEDLLYFVNGDLYLKDNLQNEKRKSNVSLPLLKLEISENRFLNGDTFIEAINGFEEVSSSNGFINLNFEAPKDDSISHFRIEYYTIVDKFLNKDNKDGIKKHIIDAFVENSSYVEDKENNYLIKEHKTYIDYIGDISTVELYTPEMINIGESLNNNNYINISSTTPIYTGNKSAKIKYYLGEDEENLLEKSIPKNSSIRFKDRIKITAINGKVFSKGKKNIKLTGNNIKEYIGLPFFEDSEINVINQGDDKLDSTRSHISMKYSGEDSENSINFTKTDSYSYYNLGAKSSNYLVRLSVENDLYYGKIYAIKGDDIGTKSKQVLFSPQKEADKTAPELDNYTIDSGGRGGIRIPVYKSENIDITNSIYEESGISGIKSVDIKLNKNSNIDREQIKINKSISNINIDFPKFDKLFKEKITIVLEDNNGNISNNEVNFEVYSPIPNIKDNTNNKITGKVSEELVGEPINIYRIRSGNIKRLETKDKKIKVNTSDEGIFNFEYINNYQDGLILKKDNSEIAYINEKTGKIDLKNDDFKINVENDESNFPKINIENKDGIKVYSHFVKLSDILEINIVKDFNNLKNKGLYLNIIDNGEYNFYKIPNGTTYSAGAIIIYKQSGIDKKPIFTISPDGRINYSNQYKLNYNSSGDYIILELLDKKGNKKIGQLFYKIDSRYLIK